MHGDSIRDDAQDAQQALRLRSVLRGDADVAMRAREVRVDGAKRTDNVLLRRVLAPLREARSFHQIVAETDRGAARLARLGVFRAVDPTIAAPNAAAPASPDGALVDVVFAVREGPTYTLKTGAEFSQHDASSAMSARVANRLGRGEILEAKLSYDIEPDSSLSNDTHLAAQGGPSFYVNASYPLVSQPKLGDDVNHDVISSLGFLGFLRRKSLLDVVPHCRTERGVALSHRAAIAATGLASETSVDFTWRQVAASHPWALLPSSIRKDFGHSVVSSITNTLSIDRLDDKILPTNGWFISLRNELAGGLGGVLPSLSGSVRHLKSELVLQAARYLGYGFSISGTAKTGCMVTPSFFSSNKVGSGVSELLTNSAFYDRFTLGGPSSIRGFKQAGLGPVDGNIHLGGDAYWLCGLSLFTPLPYLVDKPLKGHLFLNAGNVSLLQCTETRHLSEKSQKSTFSRFLEPVNVSAGFGIACKFSIIRLELNCCLPFRYSTLDSLQPGYQFGAGVEFL